MPEQPLPILVDLEQFTSPEQAMTVIERDQGFDGALKQALAEVIGTMSGLTLLLAFCLSAITRARGLYEGVVREVRSANPPAVFVLMRQLAETVAVVRYVADHPSYAIAHMRPEKEWKPGEPRRKSIQTLVNHMDKKYASQFKHVYASLSELTHFGSTAVWSAHSVVDDEQHKTVWSSHPRWRDDRPVSEVEVYAKTSPYIGK